MQHELGTTQLYRINHDNILFSQIIMNVEIPNFMSNKKFAWIRNYAFFMFKRITLIFDSVERIEIYPVTLFFQRDEEFHDNKNLIEVSREKDEIYFCLDILELQNETINLNCDIEIELNKDIFWYDDNDTLLPNYVDINFNIINNNISRSISQTFFMLKWKRYDLEYLSNSTFEILIELPFDKIIAWGVKSNDIRLSHSPNLILENNTVECIEIPDISCTYLNKHNIFETVKFKQYLDLYGYQCSKRIRFDISQNYIIYIRMIEIKENNIYYI